MPTAHELMKKYGSPPTSPATLLENNGYVFVICLVFAICEPILEFKHDFDPTVFSLAGLCFEFEGECRTTAMSGLFHSENGGRARWRLRGEATRAEQWSVGVAAGGDGGRACAFSR